MDVAQCASSAICCSRGWAVTEAWRSRRVTVVADFDSFLKAGTVYARHFESLGARIRYLLAFARPNQISDAQLVGMGLTPSQVRVMPLDTIASRSTLEREDLVLLGLNGMRTRRFLLRFHRAHADAPRRPIVASFYPGLIFRFHLEGMVSRMGADVLLLNSPADLSLYERALGEMGLTNVNAICAGLSFLPGGGLPTPRELPTGAVLFVGQPTVPVSRAERRYVVARLVERAQRFPSTEWLLKPRHRRGETSLHRDDHHFEDLLDELAARQPIPPNLRVVHDPLPELFERTALCLTFSSTAALESLLRGIPTRVLTDIGIHENIGNHFFVGSGLSCTFDDVEPESGWRKPNAEWLAEHVVSTADRLPAITARLEAKVEEQASSSKALPPPYPRLFGRAAAFENYLRETEGWKAVAEFGGRGIGPRVRLRRLAVSLRGLVEQAWSRARLR